MIPDVSIIIQLSYHNGSRSPSLLGSYVSLSAAGSPGSVPIWISSSPNSTITNHILILILGLLLYRLFRLESKLFRDLTVLLMKYSF